MNSPMSKVCLLGPECRTSEGDRCHLPTCDHHTVTWPEFYKGREHNTRYPEYFARRYAPYLDIIRGYIKPGDRVVEVGCGMASTTRALRASLPRYPLVGFHCYDICPEMVTMAQANLAAIGSAIPVEVMDARALVPCYPDILHGHGLLEHFSNADIKAVLEAGWKSGARVQVHYVPGNMYATPSFGDERLEPLSFWEENFKPTHTKTFNTGFDYALIWEYR